MLSVRGPTTVVWSMADVEGGVGSLAMSPTGPTIGFGPQPAKNFASADGYWATYITRQPNIYVGLLNLLLSTAVFSGAKMVKNALAAGDPSSDPAAGEH